MNEKTLEHLQNVLKYHGFGDTLNEQLQAHLQKASNEFTLALQTEVNKRPMDATLYFKKSDSTELYFFNKYDARLQNEKNEVMSQTFYINRGSGVTVKEAYNLLNGRAVHKEFTDKENNKYQAWIQLDLTKKDNSGNYERKQFHQQYGYDLREAISYYPVKDMQLKEDADKLMKSLEKGNVQSVRLDVDGKEVKVFLEANPQYKNLTVYDEKMKRLDKDARQAMMVTPSTAKEQKTGKDKTEAESKEVGVGDDKKKTKASKVKATEDNGLIPKKRSSDKKKGLGV